MAMAPVIVVNATVNHFMKECVVKNVGYVTLGAIIVFIGKKTFRNNILPNICTPIFCPVSAIVFDFVMKNFLVGILISFNS
jgi:hypothetical protein